MRRRRDLAGARVLITGAAGGIGSATSAALLARGAKVAGVDTRGGGDLIQADVRDERAAEEAVGAAVARLGGLDVLVNNAGIGHPQDTGQMPDAGALATLEVNLLGAWRMTSAALPHLLAARGQVVNVVSALAWINVPFAAAYCVSKRALTAYAGVLRLEYADWLEVATVYPGYVRTGIHEGSASSGLGFEGHVSAQPVEAVARTIVRACEGGRRDLATSWRVAVGMAIARVAPGWIERVQIRRLRRRVREGAFDHAPLAAGLRERLSRPRPSPGGSG